MLSKSPLLILAASALLAAGCTDNPPMYGRADTFARTHLQFGDGLLQDSTRVDPVSASRDQFGLLHVTLDIRSTTDKQQYVDCFIQFYRNGVPVGDKIGPKTVTLMANLPATIAFDASPQPADDYVVSLSYAR